MPELPEVETVRRGLQPAMEGARFVKVEARRPDLRFPLTENFAGRLKGQTVKGLDRRAKYLLAALSSGDVLLMHLGMSGSFRVSHDDKNNAPGKFHHERSKDNGHDHIVFHMSSGATVTYNDPRRFGFMKIISPDALATEPLLQSIGPEPLGNAFDAAMLAASCSGKENQHQGGAARSDHRHAGLRQYLCVRGAASRACLAEARWRL